MIKLLNPSKLAGKITLLTFAASILWIVVISTTLLFFEYRLNERDVIEKLTAVVESNRASLSRSIWEFERQLLTTQLEAMVQLPSISYARLEETDGKISQFGNISQSYPKEIAFSINFIDRGETIQLGCLKIYPDLGPLNEDLISLAFKIFCVQTVNAFVVAIIIFLFVHFFAGRHLTDIAVQAGAFSADRLEVPIRLKRKPRPKGKNDELDILETALNDMRIHLISAFSELKISEERHRKLFETMPQGVIYQEPDGKILSINPAASKILGLGEKHLSAIPSFEPSWKLCRENGSPISPGEHPAMVALTTGKAVMDQVLCVYNQQLKEYRWLRVNAIPLIKNGEATPYQVHLTLDDITRRKKARELMNRYVHIISSTNDLMSFIDNQYIYQAVNDSYLKYHDKKREDIINFSIPSLMGAKTFESVVKPKFDRALAGETINFQAWFDYPKVGRRYMSVTYSPSYKKSNLVDGVVVSVHDMTEIKLAEDEIRELRNYLSNIINSMPSKIIGVNQDGIVTQWNLTVEKKTGITAKSAIGKALTNLIPQMTTEMEKIAESIRTGEAVHGQKRTSMMDGEKRFEEMTIYPLIANGVSGAVIRIDDVTKKVQMEEMMVQSEKMLSVGGLAAGMAHEINNPLAGVMQTADVMKLRLQHLEMKANLKTAKEIGVPMKHIKAYMEQRGIFRMINAINESGMRIRQIVDNMLCFARKPNDVISTHKMNLLLDQALDLAATDYDLKKQYDFKKIKIFKEYEDNLPMVPCEASKIQQVVLNILRNGAQAMESHDAGDDYTPCFYIRLTTEKDAGMMRIEIQDNGPGMTEKTRKKIFEPFYTTKAVGEGTGLGLSVSYFIIVENHGGTMDVVSSPGQGTKFIISLPLKRRNTL